MASRFRSEIQKPAKLNIRPMRVEDIEKVIEIDRMSFSMPWSIRSYRYEVLQNEHSACWIAETNESGREPEIIGMLVMWLIIDEAHIATIATHPAFRRCGTAKSMLRTALMDVIRKGALSATLEVREGNTAARSLYGFFGFREVGRRKHYYSDNHEDAMLMTVFGLNEEYLAWLENGSTLAWKGVD